MSVHADCPGCLSGDHSRHVGPWNVREGLIGGAYCVCDGDCAKRLQEAADRFFGCLSECSCGQRFVHSGALHIHIGRLRGLRPTESHLHLNRDVEQCRYCQKGPASTAGCQPEGETR